MTLVEFEMIVAEEAANAADCVMLEAGIDFRTSVVVDPGGYPRFILDAPSARPRLRVSEGMPSDVGEADLRRVFRGAVRDLVRYWREMTRKKST